jgi:signal transduction histidine kinase
MLRKILQTFTGEKKYFSFVILTIFIIFLSAIISPNLINRVKRNWNDNLPQLVVKIENSSIEYIKVSEDELYSKESHLKKYIRENLEPQNFSYRSLIRLINDKEFENFSVEIIAPNGRLIAWNKKLAIQTENVFPLSYPLGEDFFYNGNLTTYLSVIDSLHIESDNFYVIVSIPIEKHFVLQNQYYSTVSLIKELSDKFMTEFKIDYSPISEGTKDGRYFSYELLNRRNNKIAEVTFAKPLPAVVVKNIQDGVSKFQSILAAIGIIFLTLGFRTDFRKIKFKSVRLAIILIYCVTIRILFYIINFPSGMLEGSIKDSSYFSSTFAGGIVRSPIEFFITAFLLLIFCLQIFRYLVNYLKTIKAFKLNEKLVIVFLGFFIIFLLLTIRGLNAAIRSIIFDSTLRYFKEPNLIPDLPSLLMNLNLLLVGSAVLFLLLFYALFFTACIPQGKTNFKYFLYSYLITQICGFIYIFIQPQPLVSPFLSFFIITIVFGLVYYIYYVRISSVYNYVFVAVAGSLISISLLIHFNQELEQNSLKTTALEINRPNDNLLNFILTETLVSSAKNNNVIDALYRNKSNFYALAFELWSKSTFQMESINSSVSILNKNQKELGSFKTGNIDSIENYSYGISNLTTGDPLIFQKNDDKQSREIISGIIPVMYNGELLGYIAATVEKGNQSFGTSDIPDFLESGKIAINSIIEPSQLTIFQFADNKLDNVVGDIYPSRDQVEPILNAKYNSENESWTKLNLNGEEYITFLLKDNSDIPKTTAVLLKVKDISWNLFNFFKIFILHSIFIFLVLSVMLFYQLKNIRYSFRVQLLIAFLLISLLPLILLAIYNRQVVSRRSTESITSELHERADYIERYIKGQKNADRENLIKKFEEAGSELGITFSVYDESDELYSSKDQYYYSGIFSRKLNPKIFYYLNYLSYREYLIKESIDNFNYNSFYKKFTYGGKTYILGVNDAFNKVKINFSVAEVDVFLFGVYSFAILVIIILSTLLANKISFPIRNLTKAMSSVKKGDLNVQIESKERGELKGLIDGFNSMVHELRNNQEELAVFEREKAWKEMARQVAHEIKNPLTPMKLSMQQLIISFRDKKDSFASIFEKLSTTILNQIENLNQIASEFSSFARMPRVNLERVNLLSVIRDITVLYADKRLKIEIKTGINEAEIEADITQLRRLFINMMRNSIQAKSSIIEINIKKEFDNYQIFVKDNGIGIPLEFTDRIFEENFTTKGKGMGIGLKLARKYLEEINGKIELVNTSSSGTTFQICIPMILQRSS